MTIRQALLTSILLISSVSGFAPASGHSGSFTGLYSEVNTAEDATAGIQTDPKEAVKLFGRLAEKYIMLDASAGMCCYSGCTGENEHNFVPCVNSCRTVSFSYILM